MTMNQDINSVIYKETLVELRAKIEVQFGSIAASVLLVSFVQLVFTLFKS